MGIFNTIVFKCPYCGGRITCQSRECVFYYTELEEFNQDSVPVPMAEDWVGGLVSCKHCVLDFEVTMDEAPPTVKLGLKLQHKKVEGV